MSERKDGSAVKRARLQKMHKMLQGAGDVPLDYFLANCSYILGFTHETTLRYLRDLEKLGFVDLDETTSVIREVVKA